jgi:hypothetical protein
MSTDELDAIPIHTLAASVSVGSVSRSTTPLHPQFAVACSSSLWQRLPVGIFLYIDPVPLGAIKPALVRRADASSSV